MTAIRPTTAPTLDRQVRTASALATTVTGLTAIANVGKVIALDDRGYRPDKLTMQQFNRGGVMTAMAFLSTAGNTYAAVNDFKNGHHVKGFLRAMSAAGSGAAVLHAATGGRMLAGAVIPGVVMAASCGIVAKIMDQSR
jgi:hypothetical protein